MFDRILLLLLILLLPLGILASRVMTGELKIGTGVSSASEKKIQLLVDKLNQQVSAPAPSQQAEIAITATIYSSTSATLNVSGIAPETQAFLWIWSASSKSKKVSKTESPSATAPFWSGPLVIWPKAGGSFTASVDAHEMAGIAEIRIEQNKAVSVVRYDLDNQKQLQ